MLPRWLKCPACKKQIKFPAGFPSGFDHFLCRCTHCAKTIRVAPRRVLGYRWPKTKAQTNAPK